MKLKNKKIIIYLVFISVILLVIIGFYIYFYFNGENAAQKEKCPDDYATEEEQLTALDLWSSNFFKNYPNATISDWSKARQEFWVKNNCIKAIERYKNAEKEKIYPEILNRVNNIIQPATNVK